jgi:hypothetical protein
MLDFDKFAADHSIEIATEGHKHCRPGWAQIECPLCSGNPGYHLGYNYAGDYFNCWRCGFHGTAEIIRALLSSSWHRARALVKEYDVLAVDRPEAVEIELARECVLPSGSRPLPDLHKSYLRRRNFDPEHLVSEWGLVGTGPVGGYKFRIIAPIYIGGVLVSYQGRDVTGKQSPPYKACPQKQEVMRHQNVLYGIDKVPGSKVAIVEGITDAWRLGAGAVATFGIDFTTKQLRLLAEFETAFVIFDPADPQARSQAEKLAMSLALLDVTSYVLDIDADDPALLTPKEAKILMEDLFR